MRALWRGETVTHVGRVSVREAKLYTRPATPPPLIGAAITAETAEWVGSGADGLITVGASSTALRSTIAAFHRGGGRGKRLILPGPAELGSHGGREALRAAHDRWRHAGLGTSELSDLETPAAFDDASALIKPEELRSRLRISADLDRHRRWLEDDLALGFDEIYLHVVGPDPRALPRRLWGADSAEALCRPALKAIS